MADEALIPLLVRWRILVSVTINNDRRFASQIELVAAGVYVEDKRLPKMNSFRSHAHLLANPMEVFGRVRAIEQPVRDLDFVVVARMEPTVCRLKLEAALERCNCHRVAGADQSLVHSKRRDAEEIKAFAQAWGAALPRYHRPTTSASTPISFGDSRLPDHREPLASLLRAVGRPTAEKGILDRTACRHAVTAPMAERRRHPTRRERSDFPSRRDLPTSRTVECSASVAPLLSATVNTDRPTTSIAQSTKRAKCSSLPGRSSGDFSPQARVAGYHSFMRSALRLFSGSVWRGADGRVRLPELPPPDPRHRSSARPRDARFHGYHVVWCYPLLSIVPSGRPMDAACFERCLGPVLSLDGSRQPSSRSANPASRCSCAPLRPVQLSPRVSYRPVTLVPAAAARLAAGTANTVSVIGDGTSSGPVPPDESSERVNPSAGPVFSLAKQIDDLCAGSTADLLGPCRLFSMEAA
ncbi:hypothetical protein CWO89_39040 [Bradyrhizobium sp. Leo170]|nr:hypothetical protein CWO90_43920 [Bradyrhizobium sp. Leo121]TAI60732.1 hypothetical protein CWO89_39040 [Bradyrhizobium sp. Leo170]